VQGGFTVNYATANGTAPTADTDYVAATGTLTFAGTSGETQTFSVAVNGDLRFEPDETLTVSLSGASNAAVSTLDTATGTIRNDDTAPGFVVTPTTIQTTEAGGSATFTVALAAQPITTVTLPLSSNDTGEGSVSLATLAFTAADWATPQTVTVTGVDDAIVDGSMPTPSSSVRPPAAIPHSTASIRRISVRPIPTTTSPACVSHRPRSRPPKAVPA
jgi:hypothetical protein